MSAYEKFERLAKVLVGPRKPMAIHSEEKNSMGKYFNQQEVFPVIADSIRRIHQGKLDFVSHEEIVQGLLGDPVGKELVEKAYQEEPSHSRGFWAGNMVAFFSKRITEGESDYASEFERKMIGNDWAYKPAGDPR